MNMWWCTAPPADLILRRLQRASSDKRATMRRRGAHPSLGVSISVSISRPHRTCTWRRALSLWSSTSSTETTSATTRLSAPRTGDNGASLCASDMGGGEAWGGRPSLGAARCGGAEDTKRHKEERRMQEVSWRHRDQHQAYVMAQREAMERQRTRVKQEKEREVVDLSDSNWARCHALGFGEISQSPFWSQ